MSEVEKVPVYYILRGYKIISVDVSVCAKWMARYENRIVKKTLFEEGVFVYTLFLGTDEEYSLDRGVRPKLFKTSISGGSYAGSGSLSCEYIEAMKCHQRAVQDLRDIGYIELSSLDVGVNKYAGQKIVVLNR